MVDRFPQAADRFPQAADRFPQAADFPQASDFPSACGSCPADRVPSGCGFSRSLEKVGLREFFAFWRNVLQSAVNGRTVVG
jgi:hypothetical protein